MSLACQRGMYGGSAVFRPEAFLTGAVYFLASVFACSFKKLSNPTCLDTAFPTGDDIKTPKFRFNLVKKIL